MKQRNKKQIIIDQYNKQKYILNSYYFLIFSPPEISKPQSSKTQKEEKLQKYQFLDIPQYKFIKQLYEQQQKDKERTFNILNQINMIISEQQFIEYLEKQNNKNKTLQFFYIYNLVKHINLNHQDCKLIQYYVATVKDQQYKNRIYDQSQQLNMIKVKINKEKDENHKKYEEYKQKYEKLKLLKEKVQEKKIKQKEVPQSKTII